MQWCVDGAFSLCSVVLREQEQRNEALYLVGAGKAGNQDR